MLESREFSRSSADPQEIVRAIRKVLPKTKHPTLKLHAPDITDHEKNTVAECFAHDGVCGYEYVDLFEIALAKRCKVKHAIAMSNGTAALHVALMCVGVKRDTDVIMPSLTFAATANAVQYIGALPHFLDCVFNLDCSNIEKYLSSSPLVGYKNDWLDHANAIIAVDVLGSRVNTRELADECNKHGLPLIEDAAQAIGEFQGMNGATAAIMSFNTNKIVTTGSGGALLTDDGDVAEWARKLSTTARIRHPWLVEHERVAWNYRIPNLCAAMGLAQLERLDKMKAAKRELSFRYLDAFRSVDGVRFCIFPWLNAIEVENRNEALAALHADGIEGRALFTPMHRLEHFSHFPRSSKDMPRCIGTWDRVICLPSGSGLI